MCNEEKVTDILGMEQDELGGLMNRMGEPAFRSKQIYSWLHRRREFDYGQMTDISTNLRERLSQIAPVRLPEVVKLKTSKQDGTKKYLFSLSDGQLIESVLMHYLYGYSVCISSQVGCEMGCVFCASTLGGLIRNLTAGEMLGQVYRIASDLGEDERISHIVVMGVGEPLLNEENLVRFIRIITSESGYDLSIRNITVSTCGIVPGILAMAQEELPVTLALSLHAPTQELREKLMPAAKKYPLNEVIRACDEYFNRTGRRMTYEYAMIRDVNDRDSDADAIVSLLKGRNAHINLIPLNSSGRGRMLPSLPGRIRHFQEILAKSGINVTIRRSLGSDIDGACGQLRRKY